MLKSNRVDQTNNFDLIRLLAAAQVVLGHSREHLEIDSRVLDTIWFIMRFFPGVPIFFVVSGFLISRSYERNPVLLDYSWNRALRIFPALWVCFVVSLVSVFCTNYDLVAKASDFWLWVATQVSALAVYNPEFMRGYGVGVLNGSLWTIPVELQFYLAIPVVYSLLRIRPGERTILFLFVTVVLFAIRSGFNSIDLEALGLAGRLVQVTLLPYLCIFFVGIALQRHFKTLRVFLAGKALYWMLGYAAITAVLMKLGVDCQGNNLNTLSVLSLAALTISFAFTAPGISASITRGNDISYGTYIYHMPVINYLRQCQLSGEPLYLFVTFAVTFALSLLSWRGIERPVMRFKRRPLRPL